MKKRSLVFGLLILAVMMLISITREWVVFELAPEAAVQPRVGVTGADGIQSLMPVAIALLAIGVVLGIAGKVLRLVLGALTVVFGGWSSWSVWHATGSGNDGLLSFGSRKLAEVTGIVTDDHSSLVVSADANAWPTVSLIVGILIACAGVLIMIFGWGWQRGGQRYESRQSRAYEDGGADRIADWDALSHGDDPSDWNEQSPRS